MHDTILVPLDGSKRGEVILRHVEELAQRYHATVILLQVVGVPTRILGHEEVPPVVKEQELERRKSEAEAYLNGLQREFREKGIEARTWVAYGPVVEAILSTAGDEDVDLIAMATHGRGPLGQLFYGSVAAGILQRLDRRVLLIRRPDAE